MKSNLLFLFLTLVAGVAVGQAPKLYIHIVSHNEPTDNLDALPGINYNRAKNNALQMAAIVDSKNVRWNLQTSDGFVIGALQFDSAGTSSSDVFEILASPPYNDNIEIDPRSKNKGGRNIADQWYLLDSCGANPTTHLGGCIYFTSNPGTQPVDWEQYRNPVIGNVFNNSWQCSIITGAGSFPPHTNDLNDFGVFKPDTATNFYQHNPSKNLWCMGTGCAPVLDSLDDEQAIIDLIQAQVDSIQNGLWPSDRFYVTRIMTNQREYGPLFFQKISKVIDSLNQIPSSKLQWATIGETFTAFQAWQFSSGRDYSQWRCGETLSGVDDINTPFSHQVYPNPFSNKLSIDFSDEQNHFIEITDCLGRMVFHTQARFSETIELRGIQTGVYMVRIDDKVTRVIKD